MIFTGATINDEHTLNDWGAAITNPGDAVELPDIRETLLSIPGRNGVLDLSETLTGDVVYGSRKIKLSLIANYDEETWQERSQHLFNAIHGKRVQISFDEDAEHYYLGRAQIASASYARGAASWAIEVTADPYRYDTELTVVTLQAATAKTVTVKMMPVSPSIYAAEETNLTIGSTVYRIYPEQTAYPYIVFAAGETTLTADNAIVLKYRQGEI